MPRVPITMVAFGEDIDLAATEQNIAALTDQHVRTSGDDLFVPALDRIVVAIPGVALAAANVHLRSPSMEELTNLYLAPWNGNADADVEPDDPPVIHDYSRNPVPLVRGEQLNFRADGDTTAAAWQWCGVLLGDGPVQPISGQHIFAIRATRTVTLTARAWTISGELTFVERLPVGRYAVVGMRVVSASVCLARIVLPGYQWRPGCVGADTDTQKDGSLFRNGNLGVWAEFESDEPPQVEVLADLADTSIEVWFDLILIRKGRGGR